MNSELRGGHSGRRSHAIICLSQGLEVSFMIVFIVRERPKLQDSNRLSMPSEAFRPWSDETALGSLLTSQDLAGTGCSAASQGLGNGNSPHFRTLFHYRNGTNSLERSNSLLGSSMVWPMKLLNLWVCSGK